MANGDDLKIGGFKDMSLVTSGMEGTGIGSAPVTLPNSEYNTNRANKLAFNTGFLGLTAQHTKTKFNSANFDIAFGTTSGISPFTQLSENQGKLLHTIG